MKALILTTSDSNAQSLMGASHESGHTQTVNLTITNNNKLIRRVFEQQASNYSLVKQEEDMNYVCEKQS